MSDEVVDQLARDQIRDVHHDLTRHQQTTEIHLNHIEQQIKDASLDTNKKIEAVEKAIKWAGSLLISLLLSVLGWAVVQQINANTAQQQELRRQIELLQAQERLRLLTPSATEPASPPVGVGQRLNSNR